MSQKLPGWARRLVLAALTGLAIAALAACGPEDGRARGGGPGADVGNKPANIEPHSKVYPSTDHF